MISLEQLEEALEVQKTQPAKRLGEILVQKGDLKSEGLERALSMQKAFRGQYGLDEGLKQKQDYLRQVHLFQELADSDLAALAEVCYEESFDQGHILFAEGEVGDALYLVTSGAVRLVKSSPRGGEQELAVMGAGNFFGEMALIDQGPRSATALIQRHTTLLVLLKAPARHPPGTGPRTRPQALHGLRQDPLRAPADCRRPDGQSAAGLGGRRVQVGFGHV